MVNGKTKKRRLEDQSREVWSDYKESERAIRRAAAPDPPIFLSSTWDACGYLDLKYECSFLGPSEHQYCEDFPVCEYCSSTRKLFHSAEHYIEYYKAIFFGDKETAAVILSNNKTDPIIHGFEQQTWDQVSYDVMVQANLWKFGDEARCVVAPNHSSYFDKGNSLLKEVLLQTGERSIVASGVSDDQWNDFREHIGWRSFNESRQESSESDAAKVKAVEDEQARCEKEWEERMRKDPRFYGEGEKEMWGNNLLGRALMDVRARIRSGEKPRTWTEY